MMKNESGRSMVEMLGVLAIIGVLSVGGIAGYTMAMKKYRANEVANALSQCAVLAEATLAINSSGTATCTDFKVNGVSPAHTAGEKKVTMTAPSDDVATTVAGMNPSGFTITASGSSLTMTWS